MAIFAIAVQAAILARAQQPVFFLRRLANEHAQMSQPDRALQAHLLEDLLHELTHFYLAALAGCDLCTRSSAFDKVLYFKDPVNGLVCKLQAAFLACAHQPAFDRALQARQLEDAGPP